MDLSKYGSNTGAIMVYIYYRTDKRLSIPAINSNYLKALNYFIYL